MSTKTIKELIPELKSSREKEDIQDIVRMVCMILCVTLFFPTSGINLSWSHVALLEDFDEMKTYDWAESIREKLMSSIKIYHKQPKDVKGCVVALLVCSIHFVFLTNR